MRTLRSLASLPPGSATVVFGTGCEARALHAFLTRHPDFKRAAYLSPTPHAAIDGVAVWTPDTLVRAVGRTPCILIGTPAAAVETAARWLAGHGLHHLFDPRPLMRIVELLERTGRWPASGCVRRLWSESDFRRLPEAVHVYGTGRGGRLVHEAVTSAGRRVVGFVDTFRSGTLEGLPVLKLSELAIAEGVRDVVIASEHWGEMAEALRSIGIQDAWDASPYIALRQRRAARAPLMGCGGGLAAQ